ncbi:MAG TPA: alpha-amylase family glycosyl hydrolase [Gemmataceae bacterium]|nr:alpha-amylase family glycosyl hydrolase [Gemmataceae bacterium]
MPAILSPPSAPKKEPMAPPPEVDVLEAKFPELGAFPKDQGVFFRVWAPNATKVAVAGSFNNWSATAHPLQRDDQGCWAGHVAEAQVGHEFKYAISHGENTVLKNDPHALRINNASKNAVIQRSDFEWKDDSFHLPPLNELVIYEIHVGTFARSNPNLPGTFAGVKKLLPYLKALGINAIELMPPAEFPTALSWGYNTTNPFAVEESYGGPDGLRDLIRTAHQNGIGVIVDVVYNHFGPGELDLWQFDGWSENNLGGIYFYNDHRAKTPWGDTRPDFGRAEVRQYLRDNALFWLKEFRADGLRFDMTAFIRNINGGANASEDLPDGWSLLRWINDEVQKFFPGRITIAEDLQNNEWLVKGTGAGGAGFFTQWDAAFVHPVRAAVVTPADEDRNLQAIQSALAACYDQDAFKRVIYSESHDEVANGKARVPQEISPDNPGGYFARKRSTLAAGLVFTAPGVPMLFAGQEFLEDRWFRDDEPLDWSNLGAFVGINQLYRDLIRLRLNRDGNTKGLIGSKMQVVHVNPADKVIVFFRWYDGGPGDHVVVIAHFSNATRKGYKFGLPAGGRWKTRCNSDAKVYSEEYAGVTPSELDALPGDYDGLPQFGLTDLGPYSVVVLSQDSPK